jgi:hypothetical protein
MEETAQDERTRIEGIKDGRGGGECLFDMPIMSLGFRISAWLQTEKANLIQE